MGFEGQVILVVDDDADILRGTAEVLRRRGYSPISASGPLEALKKSRDFRGEIHLLPTDLTMPEMDGLGLAKQVFAERSHIRVLLMSPCNLPYPAPFSDEAFPHEATARTSRPRNRRSATGCGG
jgi:CheY-like chemotaxis protein